MVNKYYKRSKISEAKFRQILKYFSMDLTATETAALSSVSLRSVTVIFDKLRKKIAHWCVQETPFDGIIEVDESLFGARRVKGKRGRGAYGKVLVFGLYKRNGKVYTEVVPNASKKTLQAIIRGKVALESVIHSDGWRGYNGLVNLGYAKHLHVDHGRNEFATSISHINGMEGFWGFAKTRLVKCRGMHPATFYLHLKESEFRFNYRKENIYPKLLSLIRNNPLKLS